PEIIVAIVGVETFYGVYKGKDPVFDSLVTLAFDYPRRASFFAGELEAFLLLVKEQGFDARALRGSYAGAMGMPQFIASSYRAYAVDFDQDGQVNLFDSVADIAASVANYFVRHGWQRDGRVARPLILEENNDVASLKPGMKPDYAWKDLKRSGLKSQFEIADETPVALVELKQRDHSEYWVGFQNFYVITRYNHSELYAMAVYQLAKLISLNYKKSI
ncbi:MAG: lytic murein transglycosylase B, partial [Gammaproteobacteria bacterium]